MVKINPTLEKCKDKLKGYYGKKFRGLILYGSVARKQASSTSDIDLLVLLKRPFDHFKELRRITDLLYPHQLDSKQLISAKPADVDDFRKGTIQLYRNAKHDGVAL